MSLEFVLSPVILSWIKFIDKSIINIYQIKVGSEFVHQLYL
jgi:hypothetical protein